MIDIDNTDIANHEFTGEELGELLLASVKQMKNNEVSKEHHIVVNDAVAARHKVGLSQKEFAEVMGVSVRTLQAWERGVRKPSGSAVTLLKIAAQQPQALMAVR